MLLLGDAWRRLAPLRFLTQLLNQGQHGGIWRSPHLLLQECFVRSRVLDSGGGLPRGHERLHQAERGA